MAAILGFRWTMCVSYCDFLTTETSLALTLIGSHGLHLDEVERKLADLTALRVELRQLIDQCQHNTVAECRIIETLAPVAESKTFGKSACS